MTVHVLASTAAGKRVPISGTPSVLNDLFVARLTAMNVARRALNALGLRVASSHVDLEQPGQSVIYLEPGQNVKALLEASTCHALIVRQGRRFCHVLFCKIDIVWEQIK